MISKPKYVEQKEGLKKYDAWLNWCVGSTCFFKCEYCIKSNRHFRLSNELLDLAKQLAKSHNVSTKLVLERIDKGIFRKRIQAFKMRPNNANRKKPFKINIPALMNTLSKSKKIFRISFTAGEPFLVSNMVEACTVISRDHYISFNTNLVSGDIGGFIKMINPEKVAVIHASLHIKELERLHLVNKFIENFNRMKDRGINIYAQEVGYPPLAIEAAKYKHFFKKNGIEISFGAFSGSYNLKYYPESYTNKELKQFGFDSSTRDIFNTYGKICTAGYNCASVMPDGNIFRCERIPTVLNGSHIYKKIEFNDTMTVCPVKFCACPFYLHDAHLFKKAKNGTKALLHVET